jgi:hypothetical protein
VGREEGMSAYLFFGIIFFALIIYGLWPVEKKRRW